MEKVDVTIIGAGVIGCAIAHELSKRSLDIVVLETNPNLTSDNQSSRNSGVLHSGIYYNPKKEPLKLKLCLEGNRLLYEFCKLHEIPHRRTGKLIVAVNENEEDYLEDVFNQGIENKVPVKKLTSKKTRDLEPNVKSSSSLLVPSTGIIDPTSLVKKLEYLSKENSVIFLTNSEVVNFIPGKNFEITTKREIFKSRIVINASGLNSEKLARKLNPNLPYKLTPIKGEYAKFRSDKNIKLNGLCIYPVPFGIYPDGTKFTGSFDEFKKLFNSGVLKRTLGVHLSPSLDCDTVTIGPAYSGIEKNEDYKPTFSESYFLESVQRFFPNLKLEDLSLHYTGIQARLERHKDFIIEKDPKFENWLNLIGIDSPGLTSSLAIAKYVSNLLN